MREIGSEVKSHEQDYKASITSTCSGDEHGRRDRDDGRVLFFFEGNDGRVHGAWVWVGKLIYK
jgi:hypothetical protein